jgi:hypothetical protein
VDLAKISPHLLIEGSGTIQASVNGVPAPFEVKTLVIGRGRTVKIKELSVSSSLELLAGSSLAPVDGGKIDIEDDALIQLSGGTIMDLPVLDLGNIGSDYHKAPETLGLHVPESSIVTGERHQVIKGRTLNCAEWAEKIVGSNRLAVECGPDLLLDDELIVLSVVGVDPESGPELESGLSAGPIVGIVLGGLIAFLIFVLAVVASARMKQDQTSPTP